MRIPAKLDKIADKHEAKGARLFYSALKAQYDDLAAKFEAGRELIPNNDIVKVAIISYHTKVQLEVADWQFNQMDKDIKRLQVGIEKRVIDAIRLWILGNTGVSISQISDTTLQIVKRIIAKGGEEGLGARQIGKLIRDETKGTFTRYRATVIARTEGTRGASEGAKIGAKQWENITGQTKWKAWSASSDIRTRDSHLAMVGSKPIRGDGKFNVGGTQMEAPGDEAGGAGNVVNCRCRVYYMSERIAKSLLS